MPQTPNAPEPADKPDLGTQLESLLGYVWYLEADERKWYDGRGVREAGSSAPASRPSPESHVHNWKLLGESWSCAECGEELV